MAISEIKMQIAIANYFKSECDTDTSIRQAFEKGFRIGVEKGASMNSPLIEIDIVRCGECKHSKNCTYPAKWNWCPDGERRADEHNT